MPKATQLQMDYQKPKSQGLTSGPGVAPQKLQPQALAGTKLPAGCPAGRSGGALSRKPVSSAESPWPLAGVGRRKVAARAVVTALLPRVPSSLGSHGLSSCGQANPPTPAGPGKAPTLACHCVFTGLGLPYAPQRARRLGRAGREPIIVRPRHSAVREQYRAGGPAGAGAGGQRALREATFEL